MVTCIASRQPQKQERETKKHSDRRVSCLHNSKIMSSPSASDQTHESSAKVEDDNVLVADPSNLASDPYKPTTVVLAKVKGYPAWPAMVLDESILPGNIIRSKPKSRASSSSSKTGSATRILPVRFFADDTYIWIYSHDISILDTDAIENHFIASSSKRRKDATLENAYNLARDPPDMHLFVKWGSRAAPPEKDPLDTLTQSDEVEVDHKASKRQKRPPTKAQLALEKKLAREAALEAEAKLLAEYDSDWGLEEFHDHDKQAGNYIFDLAGEQARVFSEEIQSAQKLRAKSKRDESVFQKISKELEYQLLSDDLKESTVVSLLGQLEALCKARMPETLFMRSRLLRVLILTARKPREDFPNKKVVQLVNKVLERVLDLKVRRNEKEEIAFVAPSNEPAADPSTDPVTDSDTGPTAGKENNTVADPLIKAE